MIPVCALFGGAGASQAARRKTYGYATIEALGRNQEAPRPRWGQALACSREPFERQRPCA